LFLDRYLSIEISISINSSLGGRVMDSKQTYIGSIIGLGLFLLDLKFQWAATFLGQVPSIFVISLVVGLIAGKPKQGSIATTIALIGGVVVGIVLSPVIFPEWWVLPDVTWFGVTFYAIMLPVINIIPAETSGWEALGAFIAMIVLTPIFYVAAIVFGGLTGWIGSKIQQRIRKEEPAQKDYE
jgi:hypothetical protein